MHEDRLTFSVEEAAALLGISRALAYELIARHDLTSREHTYTALSRGRDGNDLYLASHDARAQERHGPELDPDTMDRLESSLSRSISELLAVDQMPAHDTRLGTQDRSTEFERGRASGSISVGDRRLSITSTRRGQVLTTGQV